MHLGQFDYVQASEKVWGAMSSLVNAKSSFDITGVRQKKEAFESLFKRLCVKYAHLRKTLKDCHFRDAYDLATKAEGLHLYFFGGRFYPDYFMKTVIEDCVKVFEEVEKVV
jgi:hypothetical protein